MNELQPIHRPEFVEKVSSRVRVYTPTVTIEGSHHHPPGVRLSDLLRNQASGDKYMLLTDATIIAPDGGREAAEYVLISTTLASVILPLDESATSDEPAPAPAGYPQQSEPGSVRTGDRQGFGLGT